MLLEYETKGELCHCKRFKMFETEASHEAFSFFTFHLLQAIGP